MRYDGGDEAVDAVGEVLVGSLEDVREVPAAVALEALEVELDVARCGAEDVLVCLEGGLDVGLSGVRAAPERAWVDARFIKRT
jgi:hypothetical protein